MSDEASDRPGEWKPWSGEPGGGAAAGRPRGGDDDRRLRELLERIGALAVEGGLSRSSFGAEAAAADGEAGTEDDDFVPLAPESLAEAGLQEGEVEALALKYLLARGDVAGRDIAEQVKLPFVLVAPVLHRMKRDQLVVFRDAAPLNDYVYQLTELGRERARRLAQHCTYFGAAPVPLEQYAASVEAQSIDRLRPTLQDLERAFHDLLVSPAMLARLGPAICSGRGLFLYGAPGNGKTSIAKRITAAFGRHIWLPRAITVDGEIIRVFDPVNHREAPLDEGDGLVRRRKIDRRWVRIQRPTIAVGGELTMERLEVTVNSQTGICEAPIQLKSNCGTLVIDDFGRQRVRIDQLLNRWIVPLEERVDYLNLPNGKSVQAPFNQLIVFSTNLEPKALVDEAFLRRIAYKIEVRDPSEEEFRELMRRVCRQAGVGYNEEAVDYLISRHYRAAGRPFRCCHPRDLLAQIRNYCRFHGRPLELTPEFLDFAVDNYFAVM